MASKSVDSHTTMAITMPTATTIFRFVIITTDFDTKRRVWVGCAKNFGAEPGKEHSELTFSRPEATGAMP